MVKMIELPELAKLTALIRDRTGLKLIGNPLLKTEKDEILMYIGAQPFGLSGPH